MEFKKSDLVEGGSSSSEMTLDEFLDNLNENFEAVEKILDKADKTGMTFGRQPQAQGNNSTQGRGNKVDQALAKSRGEEVENSNQSQTAQPQGNAGSLPQIITQMLDNFDDDTPAETVEQELKGRVAHMFNELPEGATVGDLKNWVNTPIGQKIIENKANEMMM